MTRMDPRMVQRRRTVQETHARKNLRRLMRLLVLLTLVAAVVWLFRSPFLAVQAIDVTGTQRVDAGAVLDRSGVVAGTPMMDLDLEAAVAQFEADPWVRAAEAYREWPQTVVVEVVERVPVAWVSALDGWHHVSIDGVSLEQATQPSAGESAIIFPSEDASGFASDRELLGLLEFVTSLPPEYQAVTSVTVGADSSGETGFLAKVSGYEVRLGTGGQGREKALALMALLETGPEPGSIITVIAPGQPAVLPPNAAVEAETAEDPGANPEDG